MTRRAELLTKAADALDDGIDPFTDGWLSENRVSSDECLSLAQQLAIGARVVAYGLDHPRSEEGVGVLMSMAKQP
jgi:hypothetical protein